MRLECAHSKGALSSLNCMSVVRTNDTTCLDVLLTRSIPSHHLPQAAEPAASASFCIWPTSLDRRPKKR